MDWKILLLLVLESLVGAHCELVSAAARFSELIKLDESFMQELNSFTASVQKLTLLTKTIEDSTSLGFQVDSELLLNSELDHPTDQFLVLKRFTDKWSQVKKLMLPLEEQLKQVSELGTTLKSKIDKEESQLMTAYQGVFRLQNVYNIPARNISQGLIFNHKSAMTFNEKDSFYCGKSAYSLQDYNLCSDWMAQTEFQFFSNSLRSVDLSPCKLSQYNHHQSCDYDYETRGKLAELYDFYHFCEYMRGNINEALRLAKISGEWKPSERIQKNIQIFETHLQKNYHNNESSVPMDSGSDLEYQKYQSICRNSLAAKTDPFKEQPKFHIWNKCYITNNNNPTLLLQPIKTEIISEAPFVFQWHDFVTNHEIESIKEDALPMLQRATAITDGNMYTASYRISQSAWLTDNYPIVKRISQRISHVTNLSMETAEELQLANYGIGGQYEAHYDCAQAHEPLPEGWSIHEAGNRFSTVLIYLSNVDYGGATAFIEGNFSVQPEKGSAIFWYNLDNNGVVNQDTKHAACPVLIGIKWVANKWIHYGGQGFSHPCIQF